MNIKLICTYRATRQGSVLDENGMIATGTVVDIRFTPDLDISDTSINRQAFGHMPSGELMMTGLRPDTVADIALGTVRYLLLSPTPPEL